MTELRTDDRRDVSETRIDIVDDESGVSFSGEARNVSRSGLSFDTTLEPPVGAAMRVTLAGPESARGLLEVTRVESTDGHFRVSGKFARAAK